MGYEIEDLQEYPKYMGLKNNKPPHLGVMSAEGLEPSTNGLKGRRLKSASPNQEPVIFAQYTGR
jgi:hypothetical protein